MFQGEVLPIGALLENAQAALVSEPVTGVGVRHTAASSAPYCADLIAAGESLDVCWRFGILQTLDDYTSTLRRGGVALAALVFTQEPPRTGAVQIDAAFAALADYVAERDSWQAPAWAHDSTRRTSGWYPALPGISVLRRTGTARGRSPSAGFSSPLGRWTGREQSRRGARRRRCPRPVRELFRSAGRAQSSDAVVCGGWGGDGSGPTIRIAPTRDVDALFIPVWEIAAEISTARGLEPVWLTDVAKWFLPGDDGHRVTVFESESLLCRFRPRRICWR